MKIEEYLRDHGVTFRTHEHSPAFTAQEVAAVEHVSGNQLAKAVVVSADGKPMMCVVPASSKLDLHKVAAAAHARQVRLAEESEMARLFPDAEVGAEPPFGNLYHMPTLVDSHLSEDREIVFQGGTHRQAIWMTYTDYDHCVQPTVTDLTVHL